MITLPHGCHCSELTVNPKNWEKSNNTQKDWFIRFFFHDPAFIDKYPKGKQVVIKQGLNYYKDPLQRRVIIKEVKAGTLEKLQKGYNPITKQTTPVYSVTEEAKKIIQEMHGAAPETPMCLALIKSWERLSGIPYKQKGETPDWKLWRQKVEKEETTLELRTVQDLLTCVRQVIESAQKLSFHDIPIGEINRKFVKLILEGCGKGPARTNKIKNYLSILFNEMVELMIIEDNPTENIKKLKTTKTKRETLSLVQRVKIDEKLKLKAPLLRLFMHIFFHSGARKTELFRLKVKDVNLAQQRYRVVVKKGRQYVEVDKVIKDIALPFWSEALANSRPNDYVFSFGLVPGPDKADPDIINKLWKALVKDDPELEAGADFYSLKHSHTTEVSALLGLEKAAEHNSHTTTKMAQEVYDVEYSARQEKKVKSLQNSFA